MIPAHPSPDRDALPLSHEASPLARAFETRSLSRRQLLRAGLAGTAGAAAGLILPRSFLAEAAGMPALPREQRTIALAGTAPRHIAWVWQFQHDGDPGEIRDTLAAHGLGIALKTHDGTQWMGRYDKTPTAVRGASSVETYANFFENGGVPFHAWTVVKGRNPKREADLASSVLSAGARSLFLDLEAHPGFWVGTDAKAEEYGTLLRAAQPNARLSTSIDPRPWEIGRIPLTEFAGFTDEIAPQVYWTLFANKPNEVKYTASGEAIPDDGITAPFILASSMAKLRDFGRPIHPIGDGTTQGVAGWREFIDASYDEGTLAETVSVWRYGVASRDLWPMLRDTPPRVAFYDVQPGDTLGGIAQKFGTSVATLVELNGVTNPNVISVGTRLILPGGAAVGTSTSGSSSIGGGAPMPPAAASRRHTVEAGESLLGIAYRYDVTLSALASANGLSAPYLIRIGQVLVIP